MTRFLFIFFLFFAFTSVHSQSTSLDDGAWVRIDSITCNLEQGGYTGGTSNPDELYVLVTAPSGRQRRLSLGQWIAVTSKKVNETLLDEKILAGTSVVFDFWECDNAACGEYGEDDFIGTVRLEVKSASQIEWSAVTDSRIVKNKANKITLINLFGSQASYLLVMKVYGE